jgi:threonine/homoserine/homoserine lactone efflux protein
MAFNELLAYMTLVVVFALTPGPNMMLFLTYTFEYGRKAGWATAAGVVSSFVIHITALILGLTALLVATPYALDTLRYCGIAYLIYLAVRNLKTVQWKEPGEEKDMRPISHFFTRGFIGNLLNPGSLFLYFSLLPQFIHPQKGNIAMQNILLGGLQMTGSFITNCTVIFFAGFATNAFFKNQRYQQRMRWVMSFLIIVFAVKMLFLKF